MRRRCCPPPEMPPLSVYPNCEVTYTRACVDGSGYVIKVIPAAFIWADTQEEANDLAEELARGRALRDILVCATLSPDDLADCGSVEETPVFNPTCGTVYCNGSGLAYCDGDETEYTPS